MEHVDLVREQFTRQAEVYARMSQTTDQKGLDALVKLSGATAGQRILDVACGPGFLTMTFAARGARVTGFDATDAFLHLARAEAARRGLSDIDFRSGDAESLPFPDGIFDVIACRAAFHHFEHPARILAEMRRVARPGASLVIADMLGSDPEKATYRERMERLCDPSHARTLPESEFRQLFADAGLEVRYARSGPMDMAVEEWIEHGGPSAEVARELRSMMEASVDEDLSGLSVRRRDDQLVFSYQAAAFLLARPA